MKNVWRISLRAFAMALGTFALVWGVTGNGGITAALVGALTGAIGGEVIAKTKLKLSVLVGATVASVLLFLLFAYLCTEAAFVSRAIGPAHALLVSGILEFFALATGVVGLLRVVAARKPSLVSIELVAVAGAITTAFAAHREGNLARPLWLSEWAWRNGIDPGVILLSVGFGSVALLAGVLLSETKSRRALSGILTLLALGLLLLLVVNVEGTPKPNQKPDVPATIDSNQIKPPPPIDGGQMHLDGGPPTDGGGGGGSDATADAQLDGGGGGMGDGSTIDAGASDGGSSSAKDASEDSGGAASAQDGGGSSQQQQQASDGGEGQPPPKPRLSEDPSNSPSPAPVAVVILEDDYSPPYQAYYFRQEALSQFNGTRLVSTGRTDADDDFLTSFPSEETKVHVQPPKWGRKLVHTRTALMMEHPNPFGLEAPLSFAPAKNPNPQRFVRMYRATSLAQTAKFEQLIGKKVGDPKWSQELFDYYTQGPTDPRYKEYAESIVAKLPPAKRGDKVIEAIAVKLALDEAFTYSTKAKHEGMADPTADFLFGSKIGYCVHFAHAAVFLWRSLGIPARAGVGYHSDEDNRHGGSAIVLRGSDAHMWPEIYVDGIGWVVLDIAAKKNLDPPAQPVDEDLSKLLGDLARDEPDEQDDPSKQEKKRSPPLPWAKIIGFGLLGLLATALVVLYTIKTWRRMAPAFASRTALPIVGYRAALDRLAEVGYARDFGETREDFAKRVAKAAPSFEKLTGLHVAARLRGPNVDRATAPEYSPTEWRAASRAVKKELGAKVGFFKRLLGWLKPTSFFASR